MIRPGTSQTVPKPPLTLYEREHDTETTLKSEPETERRLIITLVSFLSYEALEGAKLDQINDWTSPGVNLRLLLEAGDFILGELGRHEEVGGAAAAL